MKSKRIIEKLEALVEQGAAPGFQLVLGYKDKCLGTYSVGLRDLEKKRPLYPTSFMDLASLTKVISTSTLLMFACQEKLIPDLSISLKQFFPFLSSELKNQSLHSVLHHSAGLPAVFEETEELAGGREEKKRFFLKRIDETYDVSRAGETLYSDIGYMLLGMVLEVVFAKRLRHIFASYFPEELGLMYGPLDFKWDSWAWIFSVPTYARTYSLSQSPVWLEGRCQDPRAAWLEGDAGHAGLFGNAYGVETWGRELYLSYHGKGLRLSDQILHSFFSFDSPYDRFLGGFDTPTQSENYISQAGFHSSKTTVGHLGYTGCSFWMDLERGYRITLLSHRHRPNGNFERLMNLRPGFHDWLYEEVFFKLKS